MLTTGISLLLIFLSENPRSRAIGQFIFTDDLSQNRMESYPATASFTLRF